VTNIDGNFSRGDTVLILSPNGQKIGRGLVEYDAEVAAKVMGLKSPQIQELLGPTIRTAMIHRDDMVLEG